VRYARAGEGVGRGGGGSNLHIRRPPDATAGECSCSSRLFIVLRLIRYSLLRTCLSVVS